MPALIRLADCPPQPWKNGAGATRELFRRDDGAGAMRLRLSIAELSGNQPFSSFPGVDRCILQLDGPAMQLTVNGVVQPLAPERPFAFAGEAEVTAQLDGADCAHDFNLMVRREIYAAAMRVHRLAAGEALACGEPGQFRAVLALAPCVLAPCVLAAPSLTLGRHDLVVFDHDPGPVVLRAQTPAALVLALGLPRQG